MMFVEAKPRSKNSNNLHLNIYPRYVKRHFFFFLFLLIRKVEWKQIENTRVWEFVPTIERQLKKYRYNIASPFEQHRLHSTKREKREAMKWKHLLAETAILLFHDCP